MMRFFHLADASEAFLPEMERATTDRVVFDTFNRCNFRLIYNWAFPLGSRLNTLSVVSDLVESVLL